MHFEKVWVRLEDFSSGQQSFSPEEVSLDIYPMAELTNEGFLLHRGNIISFGLIEYRGTIFYQVKGNYVNSSGMVHPHYQDYAKEIFNMVVDHLLSL